MAEAEESALSIANLPALVQLHIVDNLPIAALMRCRGVSRAWREVVDVATASQEWWHRRCSRDHPAVCDAARAKCSPDLTWRQLYRSLHLWAKRGSVDEYNWIELIKHSNKHFRTGVCGVQALNGQILVKEEHKIFYFNLDGDKIGEFDTELQQVKFDETDNLIVYIGNTVHSVHDRVNEGSELRIIKKVNGKPDTEGKIVIRNVENFVIVGNDVYYNIDIQQNENKGKESVLYCCRAKENYASTKLKTFPSQILTYGYTKNRVNILLTTHEIFVQENEEFVQIDKFDSSNGLIVTRKYNFQPTEDFLYDLSIDCIILVTNSYCIYEKWVFLGDNYGNVRVYDADKFLKDPMLLFEDPVETFSLYEALRPVNKSWRNVNSIDIMEKNNGHIIIASLPKGAYAIELNHHLYEEPLECADNQNDNKSADDTTERGGKKRKYK